MVSDERDALLAQQLVTLGYTALRDAEVFRHMLAGISPARINIRGARWNPPDVAAIYTSFSRETALAEADYYLSLQTPPLQVRRTLHRIRVNLARVVRIPDVDALIRLGVERESFESGDFTSCQRVGGAVADLGNDGRIVPSVRHAGSNLVIFPRSLELDRTEFEVLESEIIDEARPRRA